jgi:hypothetical protein
MRNNETQFDSQEDEIRQDFIKQMASSDTIVEKTAQMDTAQDDMGAGEMPEGMMGDVGDEAGGGGAEAAEVADPVEDTLGSSDTQTVETLDWENFTVETDEGYADMLVQEQNLSLEDALDKACYIRYKTPEEILAVQGTVMGKDSATGEGLIEVGGYDRYETLSKQMDRLKGRDAEDEGAIYPGGIPESLKEELLVPLNELSPAYTEYKDSKETSKQERKIKEVEEPAKEDETDEDMEEGLEMPELEETEPSAEGEAAGKSKKLSPTIPSPVGKVKSNLNIRMTKIADRLDKLNDIK